MAYLALAGDGGTEDPLLPAGRAGVLAVDRPDGAALLLPTGLAGVPELEPELELGRPGDGAVLLPDAGRAGEGGTVAGFESCFITIPSTCNDLFMAASCCPVPAKSTKLQRHTFSLATVRRCVNFSVNMACD